MSSASARVGATHMATSSPTCRTLPVASTGCSEILNPGSPDTARIGLTPARSAAVNTTSRKRSGTMNGLDAGMRQRAANEGDILQAGQADVGHVLAAPAHEAVVFLARQPCADALAGAGRRAEAEIAFDVGHSACRLRLNHARRSGCHGLGQDGSNRVVAHAGAQAEHRLQQAVGDDFGLFVVAQDVAAGLLGEHADIGIHARAAARRC